MNDLIILDCEQGSEEWHLARLGIPTATGLSNIVTSTGGKSSSYLKYLAELITARIEGLQEGFTSNAMDRGKELEPKARSAYEWATKHKVLEVGGVFLNKERDLMVSPDGLIPELKKGLEIKCPLMKTHIRYLLEGILPTEYKIQVQANLWVTGYDSWDFVSYCPEYKRQPLFIYTEKPNQAIFKAFDKYVPEFISKLKAMS